MKVTLQGAILYWVMQSITPLPSILICSLVHSINAQLLAAAPVYHK